MADLINEFAELTFNEVNKKRKIKLLSNFLLFTGINSYSSIAIFVIGLQIHIQ